MKLNLDEIIGWLLLFFILYVVTRVALNSY